MGSDFPGGGLDLDWVLIMEKTSEPFWWSLFSAGGTLAALFVPVLLFLNGLAFPLGWLQVVNYETMFHIVKHPFTRLFLFVLISISLFHWAHRFRFTLYDGLQLKHLTALITVICYGGAVLVTMVAAYTLLTI